MSEGTFSNIAAHLLNMYIYVVPYEIGTFSVIEQSNLNISNTHDSFIIAHSNSFLSPYEVLPIAQENKYLGTFSYSILTYNNICYVYSLESPHRDDSNEYT